MPPQVKSTTSELSIEAILSGANSINRHSTLDHCYAQIKENINYAYVMNMLQILNMLMLSKWTRIVTVKTQRQIKIKLEKTVMQ